MRRAKAPLATSDMVVFNYRRPVRARRVGLPDGDGLWLVEMLDLRGGLWVWQDESAGADAALERARRLSLMLE
ncbi:hypothetical protein DK842_07480 [Chromobacterium phragmitis]|uniref:Uncharacterized protein n=1 Tax=Chromobacterium phragmitis TaxID=2202141 RepID=A0A344UIN1_9NEIS|nr:hypothetical protein [Chromobacterium phragmitis]AXE29742.1 hypothetical protein DK842_07480 [Chromobacterium phragmitis]AXE35129.1 hypothetical protein DK843_13020 [Chromobacterium phragmitis]